MKKTLLLSAFLFVVLAACDKIGVDNLDAGSSRETLPLTRAQIAYIQESNNAFALNLFKEVAQDESIVVSPLSVTFALGMADNGATGTTKAQIEKALGYEDSSLKGLNELSNTLIERSKGLDSSTILHFANAVVANNGKNDARILDSFIDVVEHNYHATVCSMDFEKDDVKGYVNDWCKKHTNGGIRELLSSPPASISSVLLLNGVYFKGLWSNSFSEGEIKTEDFFISPINKTKVQMMHQLDKMSFGEVRNSFSVVSLPFGNGAYRMLFVLPEKDKTLSNLKTALDIKLWNAINKSLNNVTVDLKIPAFVTNTDIQLKSPLQKLGITNAFNPVLSEFGLMSEKVVWIEDARQKARIVVSEKGAEAFAVTSFEMPAATANMKAPEKLFHADRPFLYAITEASSGAIFFIGQFMGN